MTNWICINDHCDTYVDTLGDACPEHACDRCGGTGTLFIGNVGFKCPECHESCSECGRVIDLGGRSKIQPPVVIQ